MIPNNITFPPGFWTLVPIYTKSSCFTLKLFIIQVCFFSDLKTYNIIQINIIFSSGLDSGSDFELRRRLVDLVEQLPVLRRLRQAPPSRTRHQQRNPGKHSLYSLPSIKGVEAGY